MQHCQRDSPAGSAADPAVGPDSVLPASTKILVAVSGCGTSDPSGSTCAHSGAGFGFPDKKLSGATNPPPKSFTLVKVCVSPPVFCSEVVCAEGRLTGATN